MLIAARNAMMVDKCLPYDARVEWLEGDNTRWIDTGFTKLGDATVECTFIAPYDTLRANNCVAWGARNAYADKEAFMMRSDINGNFYARRSEKSPSGEWAASQSTALDAVMRGISTPNECILEVNGSVVKSRCTAGVWSPPNTVFNLDYPITLFKVNNTTWTTYPTKILDFKITRGEETLMNLYPVRKDGFGYMYDEVSGLLIGASGYGVLGIGADLNRGTGAFGYGSDKVSSGGGGKRKCVRRSYRRSLRPSARFWRTPLWKEVA